MYNTKYISKLNNKIFIILFILLIISNSSLTKAKIQQPNYNVSTNANEEIHIPKIKINDIIVKTIKPEEGKNIDIKINITNFDNIPFSQFLFLQVMAQEEILNRHETDKVPIFNLINQSLGVINPNSSVLISENIILNRGAYNLNAFLTFNGTNIPNSEFTKIITVLSPPIGDVNSLVKAIAIIIATIILVMLLPSSIDKFRKYKHLNGN